MQRGRDFIGVGVGAIIVNDRGDLFLAKRGKDARNERYKWEFPGGSVEFGETLSAALLREIKEEFGVTIVIDRLLDVVDHILPHEHQHWISPTFLCRIVHGEPAILEPHKCESIAWFSLDRIPRSELSLASAQSLLRYEHHLSCLAPAAPEVMP